MARNMRGGKNFRQAARYDPVKAGYKAGDLLFYSKGDTLGEFSNFYESEIKIDGKEWYHTEGYFQAMKFPSRPDLIELIRNMRNPGDTVRVGRSRQNPLRPDWERVKDDVMRTALRAKFTQNKDMKRILLETGTALLVENTENDSYWGDGGRKGLGQNKLGLLLMELRSQLRDDLVTEN